MLKRFVWAFIICFLLVFFFFVFVGVKRAHGQTLTFASQELPNIFSSLQTFMAGVKFNGSTSGAVTVVAPGTVTTYNLVLPGSVGQVGQLACVSGAPGQLGWCAPTGGGGFAPGGDLGGSATSQTVTGLDGIPISAAPTITGQVLKYNSSTHQMTPGTCP